MPLKSLVMIMALFGALLPAVASAGGNDQPVEWAGPVRSGAIRWSLTYVGQGAAISWDRCDGNDFVFRVNKNASADSDRFRIYSSNWLVQLGLKGKSPIGYNLNSTTPHLCVGFRDTWSSGGPWNLAANTVVWVQ